MPVLVQVPGRLLIRPPVATDDGHDGCILRPLCAPLVQSQRIAADSGALKQGFPSAAS
jgi:hypothetical protein